MTSPPMITAPVVAAIRSRISVSTGSWSAITFGIAGLPGVNWTSDEPPSAHLGRSVLGAPGRAVDRDRHPGGRGPRLVQRQARRDALVREEAPAGADDHREHQQVEAVDEVVVEQESDEGAAAVHLELAPLAGLELPGSGGHDVFGELGVCPLRVL